MDHINLTFIIILKHTVIYIVYEKQYNNNTLTRQRSNIPRHFLKKVEDTTLQVNTMRKLHMLDRNYSVEKRGI